MCVSVYYHNDHCILSTPVKIRGGNVFAIDVSAAQSELFKFFMQLRTFIAGTNKLYWFSLSSTKSWIHLGH